MTPDEEHEQADTSREARRAADGNRESFSSLYTRIAPAVHAWASLRIAPHLEAFVQPEDIVQEVWWRAYSSIQSYDPDRASFRSWVFGIANNVLLKALRSMRRRRDLPGASGGPRREGLHSSLEAQATSISRQAARSEKVHAILEHARHYGEDDRTLLVLCGLEGRSPKAVASMLGRGEAATIKRWQRLRARLRESLKGIDDLLEST